MCPRSPQNRIGGSFPATNDGDSLAYPPPPLPLVKCPQRNWTGSTAGFWFHSLLSTYGNTEGIVRKPGPSSVNPRYCSLAPCCWGREGGSQWPGDRGRGSSAVVLCCFHQQRLLGLSSPTVILVFGQSQSLSTLSGHQILCKTKAWLWRRPNPFKEGCEFRDGGGGKEGSAVR